MHTDNWTLTLHQLSDIRTLYFISGLPAFICLSAAHHWPVSLTAKDKIQNSKLKKASVTSSCTRFWQKREKKSWSLSSVWKCSTDNDRTDVIWRHACHTAARRPLTCAEQELTSQEWCSSLGDRASNIHNWVTRLLSQCCAHRLRSFP